MIQIQIPWANTVYQGCRANSPINDQGCQANSPISYQPSHSEPQHTTPYVLSTVLTFPKYYIHRHRL